MPDAHAAAPPTLRPFGRTELRVSELGLGCARVGGIFQPDAGGFLDLLSAALDAGINFFDTADMYAQGESELLLGRAFRGRRDRVVLASKAGYVLPAQRRLVARLKPVVRPLIRALGLRRRSVPAAVRGAPAQDFSPAHLRRAVHGSLRRLRTDHLDLFQLHSPPRGVVERGEWREAVEALRREGAIRYWGISCDDVDTGLAALGQPGVSSVQVLVNLLEPGAADALLPAARARGVAVIARECLANGLLVKAPEELDPAAVCRTEAEAARRRVQLAELRARAATEGRTLPELALSFAVGLPGVSVALVGARTAAQLHGLLAAGRR